MFKLIKITKIIFPILNLYPWGIPTIIVLGILASIAEGIGISLFIPFLQALQPNQTVAINNPILNYIDQLLINLEPQNRVLIITIFILFAILVKAVLSYTYTVLCNRLEYHTLHKLRNQVFLQLMSVSQSFWDTNKTAQMLNLIAQETGNASKSLAFFIWLIINLCVISVLGILLLLISWWLTLLVTFSLLLISGLIQFLTWKVEAISEKFIQANVYLSNLELEGFTGIKTIQAFGRENYEIARYQQASKQARDLKCKLGRQAAMIEPVAEGLIVAVLICVMFIAFWNKVSLPILVTFIFMLYRLQPQVQKFNYNLTQVVALINSIKEVYALLDQRDKTYTISGKIPFVGLKQGITFDSVSFFYNLQKHPALENISFFIPKCQTTALVGYSGAGKSTLINLIFRFYDVTSGKIYVDDYPLKELDLVAWRSHIAIVSQDVHIFSATIRENIVYGCPNARESEIITAAKQAYAHEFISQLPQDYDTFVGDRGIRLSGGQKQRISIARAILCDPEILILDEATNSLDSISEKLIQEAIDNLSKNRTVIVIAHRLSTIEKADLISVLDRGQIVEQGSFQFLLQQDGLFNQLYQLQQFGE